MYAKQAIAAAERTGYLSGQAFGLTVLCYALKQAKRAEEAKEAKESLSRIIGQIGVYKYLLERVIL